MFTAEFHPQTLVILPSIEITAGTCENVNCQEVHWAFSIGWLFWTAEVVW